MTTYSLQLLLHNKVIHKKAVPNIEVDKADFGKTKTFVKSFGGVVLIDL